MTPPARPRSRRRLRAGSSAAALAAASPSRARSAAPSSTVELGMIGCGGRGSWIADLFSKHGGYRFVACADYFQDRADRFGERFKGIFICFFLDRR